MNGICNKGLRKSVDKRKATSFNELLERIVKYIAKEFEMIFKGLDSGYSYELDEQEKKWSPLSSHDEYCIRKKRRHSA